MTLRRYPTAAALGSLATLGIPIAAGAQGIFHNNPGPSGQRTQEHEVFVQSDNPAGNAINVFAEHSDGRQKVVVLVGRPFAAEASLRTICAELRAAGLQPRSGKTWHPNTVRRIASYFPLPAGSPRKGS